MNTIDFAVTASRAARPEGAHATGFSDAHDLWMQVAHAFEGPSESRRARYAPLASAVRPEDFVVDLGCGDGTFLDLVSERGGRGLGVDLDPVQIAACRARGHEAVCGRIQDLDWSGRRPDMVSLIHIIEHIPPEEALALLREITGVLSQRGRLLIVTPNIGHPVVQENFWLDVTHVRPYPQMLLNTVAATLGFPYFQSGTMAGGLETWSYAYRDPGDELRFDAGLDFDQIVIRLVEAGHADDVEVIERAVTALSERDPDGFELDALLTELEETGEAEVAARLDQAAYHVAEQQVQRNAFTTSLPTQEDGEGGWIHPRYGYRFRFRPEDRFVGPGLVTGDYEGYESELFCALLKPASVVIDVGANIGHFSILAAQRVDAERGGRIVALEPEANNHQTLIDNLALNDARQVTVLRLAASESPGELTLHLNRNNTGDHRLVSDPSGLSDEFAATERVPVRDLDSLCEEMGLVPTLIKIDTQGHELAVFRGMRRILREAAPLHVLFEYAPSLMRTAGASPEELFELARTVFDELYIVDEAEARLLPASAERIAARCQGESHTNLLGVRRSSATGTHPGGAS